MLHLKLKTSQILLEAFSSIWSNLKNSYENGSWSKLSAFQNVVYAAIALWLRHWIPNPGSKVQNNWVAPWLTQSSILPRSVKRVPENPGNWVKWSPRSGSVALSHLNPMRFELSNFSQKEMAQVFSIKREGLVK